MSVVEALAREVGSLGAALHKLSAEQWARPTRCPPLDIRQLVAHVARGAPRIRELIAGATTDRQPEKDAVTYFQYDADAEGPVIVARAREVAAEIGSPQALVRFWDEQWSRALRDARSTDPDAVGPTVFGLMRLEDYLRTRAVEVTVHHLDVDDALAREVHPDPEALTVACDVLRGLLGTDLRPIGMEDVRFVLAGTGRASLSEAERAYLGPLAERFPLMR